MLSAVKATKPRPRNAVNAISTSARRNRQKAIRPRSIVLDRLSDWSAANWPAPLARRQSGGSSHGDDPKGYAGPGTAEVSATTAHKLAAVGFNDQLVQAMAGFGGSSGAADGSNTAPLGAETSQQPLLTTRRREMVVF